MTKDLIETLPSSPEQVKRRIYYIINNEFVAYGGDDRTSTVIHRWEFEKGYAVCLDDVNEYVNTLVPSPEDNGAVVRRAKPLFPTVAVRELIANALIHQDMTITGAGPTIELFRNRLEITNPGAPLVETDRFIDAPPRSRNEALAALMRRMGLCEEGGTGIDKVVDRWSLSTCRRPSSGPKTMQLVWCCSVPVVSPS